ncbi:hypothetical protein bcCo53_001386 (plasmid) [Borrelia coriaceae]|uniref:Uncharacterized protein n=1 Tax=Borrelia coriaceae ATCC 43381 TaxID=1408429 RepID=W5SX22_9SPIR|nr:Hypothetical protein BCO_0121201 [Borrelia coriaceae ATCC 43381]UPA17208.1 hypothetical protein bcCo53_001386 [Borrelia coriaceae]
MQIKRSFGLSSDEFDYKRILKESVEAHFLSLDNSSSAREALLKAFVARMFEFSNSNVLATSLHAYRMFFAVLGISEVEDLVLDIINKEKLPLSSKDSKVFGSCAYSDDEIKSFINKSVSE